MNVHSGIQWSNSPVLTVATLGLLGIAGCATTVGEGPAGSETGRKASSAQEPDGGDAGVSNEPITSVVNPPCGTATQAAQRVLEDHCASCHGSPSGAQGGFGTVLDVAALKQEGKVVAGDPEASPLYARLSNGTMPPQAIQSRPGEGDVQAIYEWITCGAPGWTDPGVGTYEFVDIDARLRVMLDDLRSFANPTDRERLRYLDLSNLANAGYSRDQIEEYRESLSLLVNSLSSGRQVIAPEAVDGAGLILRIDIRDYGWDERTWRLIETIYPYAVSYNPDSRILPFDEFSAEQIRRETGSDVPYVQADWLISHASRPPLYHEMLNLPDTLEELEEQLGVDVEQNIASEQVARAGFKESVPSQNQRVIERHDLGGNRGSFWISYDFASNVGDRNLFANPLDFRSDGSEVIFSLTNGLQGYFIADASGRRLDKAPTDIVRDSLARDGAVQNGLSCMNCHQEDGALPKADEVREFALTTGFSPAETEQVLALYADDEAMQVYFANDQNRYRSARAALGIERVSNETFHLLNDTHQGVLDLEAVASVLGVEPGALEQALNASPQSFPKEVVGLRVPRGGVQRDALEAVFDEVVRALGLGVPLEAREAPAPQDEEDSDEGSEQLDAGVQEVDAGIEEADAGETTDDQTTSSAGESSSSSGYAGGGWSWY